MLLTILINLNNFTSRRLFVIFPASYAFFWFLFISVYDVTRRETFTNLSEIWAKEVELYSTNQDCVKILVGNKVDKVSFTVHSKFVLHITNAVFPKSLCSSGMDTLLSHSSRNFNHLFVSIMFSNRVQKWIAIVNTRLLMLLRGDEDFNDTRCFQDGERAVSAEEGMALAQEHKCMFFECSAKTREKVPQCFKELNVKV